MGRNLPLLVVVCRLEAAGGCAIWVFGGVSGLQMRWGLLMEVGEVGKDFVLGGSGGETSPLEKVEVRAEFDGSLHIYDRLKTRRKASCRVSRQLTHWLKPSRYPNGNNELAAAAPAAARAAYGVPVRSSGLELRLLFSRESLSGEFRDSDAIVEAWRRLRG